MGYYGRAWIILWCHGWGCKPPLTASHIHIGWIKRVWAPWDAVDGHMGASLCHWCIVQVGVNLRENWGMAEPVWCCKIMVEANPQRLHPTSILDIQSVWAPWDAVDGHMGASLHCYARTGGGGFSENWSIA
jgi:hypothetical protein